MLWESSHVMGVAGRFEKPLGTNSSQGLQVLRAWVCLDSSSARLHQPSSLSKPPGQASSSLHMSHSHHLGEWWESTGAYFDGSLQHTIGV